MSTSQLSFTLLPLSPSSSSTSAPSSISNGNGATGEESKFGPRLGKVVVERIGPQGDAKTRIEMDTPALFTTTSRGVVPHISRDHYERLGEGMRWTSVPFESFLEHNPPVPVLYASSLSSSSTSSDSPPSTSQDASPLQSSSSNSNPTSTTNLVGNPLHTFLGLPPASILSLVARDPTDTREMPTNANGEVCCSTLRGVRRLSPTVFRENAMALRPDVVTALTDTPFTSPPYSQKRITKSIERSTAWLASMLVSPSPSTDSPSTKPSAQAASVKPPYAILAPLAGLTSIPARRAFSASLLEPLDNGVYTPGMPGVPNLNVGGGLKRLDDDVSGYVVDLAPLVQNLDAKSPPPPPPPPPASTVSSGASSTARRDVEDEIAPLVKASLEALPAGKPRVVTGVSGPHDVLRLVGSVGVDLFGAEWAQRCADVGVGLDFTFPAPHRSPTSAAASTEPSIPGGKREKRQLGHNLYSPVYATDFSPLADGFRAAASKDDGRRVCGCGACSPVTPGRRLYHGVDTPSYSGDAAYYGEPSELGSEEGVEAVESGGGVKREEGKEYAEPFTRAYVHHLLHTHEMGAHTLLVMHNLAVVSAFCAGIRNALLSGTAAFEAEVQRFEQVYSEKWEVREEAERAWRGVDRARGRGRLAREREREDVQVHHEVGVDP